MENKKMIDILSTLYQNSLSTLIDIGFLADTDYFDEILKNKDNYNFEFSKIYNKEYYEIILDTNFEVKRMMRPLIQNIKLDSGIDIEEIEDMDEMDDTTQVSNEYLIQDENYIYEISPISDEMVALIIETIVNSENKYYIRNLREFLFFRNYNQKEKVKNTKISDLILYNFKREFMTLKIKTSQKTKYSQFNELKNSYLFNFMLLNNVELTTKSTRYNRLFQESKRRIVNNQQTIKTVLPEYIYDSNLITYYKKAITANDVFSEYLSYYHIIEYYFDRLYNDNVVKQMQNWLKDVTILGDDESLLKFADKVKKIKGKSSENGQGNEQEAFALVLKKYVDVDKLTYKLTELSDKVIKSEFKFSIKESNMLDYYITNSVNFIGQDFKIDFNNDNTAIKNIRNRIYQTRNSLVHSKDSYKFKTYHPYDDEKYLIKEIPLIKLIAEEIIINSSNPIYD